MTDFTVSLAAARVNMKMTQNELAERLGVHPATVKNWEKGKTSPDVRHVKEVSRLSGIPMDYIFLPDNLLKVEYGGSNEES